MDIIYPLLVVLGIAVANALLPVMKAIAVIMMTRGDDTRTRLRFLEIICRQRWLTFPGKAKSPPDGKSDGDRG